MMSKWNVPDTYKDMKKELRNVSIPERPVFAYFEGEKFVKQQPQAATIVSNCDSLVFCGGCNCLETAKDLSIRLDKPVSDILYQKRGVVNIFRAGMMPLEVSRYDYRKHKNYQTLCKCIDPKYRLLVNEKVG